MFLIAKGYRIVARRWKTPFGEIDIVARRRRGSGDRAHQAPHRAERLWLAHHPDDIERDIRFDVMLVAPGRMPQHIANAFDASR